MTSPRAFAALLLLALLGAGCAGPRGPPSPPATAAGACPDVKVPGNDVGGPFDGERAFRYAAALVCDLGVDPPIERYRVPGTPTHGDAAWKMSQILLGLGWNATFQTFPGTDYEALEKGNLTVFTTSPYCKDEDRLRLRGLTFSNLVAARGHGASLYLLMAHYDSKRYASQDPDATNRTLPVLGANDGGSGVGVLVELARVLASESLSAEVRLLLVDGEDGFEDCHPDAGSLYYARNLADTERARIRGVLLLDMVGDAQARFCLAGSATHVADALKANATRLGVTPIAEARPCSVFDDHTPFEDLGIPAVDLIDFARDTPNRFPPYWHTRQDTPDKLSAQMLGDVGRVVHAWVLGEAA